MKHSQLCVWLWNLQALWFCQAFVRQQSSYYTTRTSTSSSTTIFPKRTFVILQQSAKGSDIQNSAAAAAATDNKKKKVLRAISAKLLDDNGLTITTDSEGAVTARPSKQVPSKQEEVEVVEETNNNGAETKNEDGEAKKPIFFKKKNKKPAIQEQPAQVVPISGFNVVLTHCTADFDSLASAVGLAKLWSCQNTREEVDKSEFDSSSHLPTFVVLPRGAHPSVQRFLALHKHLFPIRSLKSLPSDLSGLNRLGLVDAQRRDRIGPAEPLLDYAKRITVVDHHLDSDSDIPEASDFILDKVGSVSTLIVERLMEAQLDGDGLTEAEATLLALGIHADTGSLSFDSTTFRDAKALAWVMEQGASQAAIAEHARSTLSHEQQGVLTQALINTNSTDIHGVTVSTVLLSADGFINGLAAVTQDALELSSSDIYLLGLVYEPKSGGQRKKKGKESGERVATQLLKDTESGHDMMMMEATSFGPKEEQLLRQRLRAAFDRKDLDGSGFLDRNELSAALASSGIIASGDTVATLMETMDTDENGVIDFEEFVEFAKKTKTMQLEDGTKDRPCTLIIIGRAKAGVNLKSIKLGKLLEEKFGGGGHAKAASATVRLNDESEAPGILADLVDEIVETSLQEQTTVGDFMTSPVLSVKPDMNEKQVEDLFTRYDVRALPVVDENNDVIGLVTYKEVAAAKQRMWNKEQKRMRQEAKELQEGKKPGKANQNNMDEEAKKKAEERRKKGSTVKAWMKQHIMTVEASMTMAEVEHVLLENDVGCIPVVQVGTKQLVGMVTRTDLLRQHRYYPSLHYHNKGMSDSIAARKPIIALRKKLKQFDLENE